MSAQVSTSEVGGAAAAAAARGDRLGGEVRDDEGVCAIRISFEGSPSRLNASNPVHGKLKPRRRPGLVIDK